MILRQPRPYPTFPSGVVWGVPLISLGVGAIAMRGVSRLPFVVAWLVGIGACLYSYGVVPPSFDQRSAAWQQWSSERRPRLVLGLGLITLFVALPVFAVV